MSIAAAIEAMRAKGIADSDILDIVAHMAAAAEAPAARSSGAERTRRWRERHKASQSVTVTSRDVTPDETLPPPVSPLSPSPRPLTQNPPLSPTNTSGDEGTGESAIDGKPASPSQSPLLAQARASPAKGTRLPPDYRPAQPEIDFCHNLGMTDDRISECADEFRDYWAGVPGERGRKCDWPATFRNAARKRAGALAKPSSAYAARHGSPGGGRLAAYQRAAASFSSPVDVPGERPGVFDHGGRVLDL